MDIIETERLMLRPFSKSDAEQVHTLFCDREAMRLVGMLPEFSELSQTQERISAWQNDGSHLALALKADGSVLGYIAVNPDSEEGRADTRELGFALASEHRHHGYMREAIGAVLATLKGQGVKYVWACCFKENTASKELIQKSGFDFVQEGTHQPVNDREYETLEFRIVL